jgi:hypothetical protein
MNRERIAKMTESVVGAVAAEEIDNVKVASAAEDDDALGMVEQAIDAMIASAHVIDENLARIKTEDVPQRAALDGVRDLMETAIKPYLADVVTAMRVFED